METIIRQRPQDVFERYLKRVKAYKENDAVGDYPHSGGKSGWAAITTGVRRFATTTLAHSPLHVAGLTDTSRSRPQSRRGMRS